MNWKKIELKKIVLDVTFRFWFFSAAFFGWTFFANFMQSIPQINIPRTPKYESSLKLIKSVLYEFWSLGLYESLISW